MRLCDLQEEPKSMTLMPERFWGEEGKGGGGGGEGWGDRQGRKGRGG